MTLTRLVLGHPEPHQGDEGLHKKGHVHGYRIQIT